MFGWQGGKEHLALLDETPSPNLLWLRGPFTDRGLENLRGLDGLFALDLDDARLALTAACLDPLRTLPRLASLAVDAKDDWMPGLAQLPALRFLIAQDTTASDDAWVALAHSRTIEQIGAGAATGCNGAGSWRWPGCRRCAGCPSAA